MTTDAILDGLNPRQLEAVLSRAPAVLVIAGAGSGKTRVLTHRIAYLISEGGVSPHEILALTFTRKAAQQMKDQLATMLPAATARKIWVGTFHAISLRILEANGARMGYQRFISVYDEQDQEDILAAVLSEIGLRESLSTALRSLATYSADCRRGQTDPTFSTVLEEYRQRLKGYNAVDFGLLLTETLALLEKHKDVWQIYHDRFSHIMIDEYQDVDRTQYYLHEVLAPRNIFVVGDHDQSIYKFRGSDVQIVLDFQKNHDGAELITLEQSYRCPSNVLDMANNLIVNNANRIEKKIWTEKGAGVIEIRPCATADDEASYLCASIKRRIFVQGKTADQIAVLTRKHSQHELIAAEFERWEVPFTIIGATREWWKGGVGRDVVSMLSYLHNRRDVWRFTRIARTLIYPMSEVEWTRHEVEALKAGRRISDYLIDTLGGQMLTLLEWFEQNRDADVDVVAERIEGTGIFQSGYLKRGQTSKAGQIHDAVEKLLEWRLDATTSVTTAGFLEWIADQDTQKEITADNSVKIATIHAVKGLEFRDVYLAGTTEGTLPHGRSVKENDVDEERRLCYVAVTRSAEQLTITFPLALTQRNRVIPQTPSRFIEEMTTPAAAPPAGFSRIRNHKGHQEG